jgi:hypothetical protein
LFEVPQMLKRVWLAVWQTIHSLRRGAAEGLPPEQPARLTIDAVLNAEIRAILGQQAVAHESSVRDAGVAAYRPQPVLPEANEIASTRPGLAVELRAWIADSRLGPVRSE